MRFSSALLGALIVASAGCSTSSSTSGATLEHLRAALAGAPDATDVAAAKTLAPLLDAADWFYLANATWPADSATVLADPRLQKAIQPLLMSTRSGASSSVRTQDTSDPQIQGFLDQAEQLLRQANGASTAKTPSNAAALAATLATAVTTLPPPGKPADPTTDSRTISFYKMGMDSGLMNTGTPPCCKGELVFPAGTFTCYDAISCRGRGEPPAGGVTATGSAGTSGGDGGSAPGTCCFMNTDLQCNPYQYFYCGGVTPGAVDPCYFGPPYPQTCAEWKPKVLQCCTAAGGTPAVDTVESNAAQAACKPNESTCPYCGIAGEACCPGNVCKTGTCAGGMCM